MMATKARPRRVTPVEDTGVVVRETDPDAAVARMWAWWGDDGYERPLQPPIARLFRWNPCRSVQCCEEHIGHLMPADRPGPGVWHGFLFPYTAGDGGEYR